MLVNGDKIVLKKPIGNIFTNVGEICDVLEVDDKCGIIKFSFCNGLHMGIMSNDEFAEYFDKYEVPKKNTVTNEMIEQIMNHSEVIVNTLFDKCTVVACKLPNGFVIVESSSCVDPENYDEKMGVDICMKRIIDKVWELEGYRLQQMIYDDNSIKECTCESDCENCGVDGDNFCPYHCNNDCDSCERNN